MSPSPAQRFEALDGVRGLAAMAVMVYHFTVDKGHHYPPNAWAAVDLFFILSGFVLAHSYSDKIRAGLGWRRFALLRLIRLMPLYVVGSTLGAVAVGYLMVQGQAQALTPEAFWKAVAMAAVLVPDFDLSVWPVGTGGQRAVLFPLNPPAWSLFFELFVNALFFAVVLRCKPVRWPLVAALVLGYAALQLSGSDANPGWERWNFVHGFPRVVAEFALGMLIHRHHRQLPATAAWLAVPLLVMVFYLFFQPALPGALGDVFLLEPLAILCCARLGLNAAVGRGAQWLGELSYPLYITHMPVYYLGYNVFGVAALPAGLRLVVLCTAAVALAITLVPIGKRIRRALMRRLG